MKKNVKFGFVVASVFAIVGGTAVLLKKFLDKNDEEINDDLEDFDEGYDDYDDTYDNMHMDKREYFTLNSADEIADEAPQEKREDMIDDYVEENGEKTSQTEDLETLNEEDLEDSETLNEEDLKDSADEE